MSNKEALIFEVSKNNFDSGVIENSHKVPVLVEFMGIWSGPCIQMSEEIMDLAKEFAGEFIFAKVDMDEQPELIKQYDVENVPALRVFKDGDMVRGEEGQFGLARGAGLKTLCLYVGPELYYVGDVEGVSAGLEDLFENRDEKDAGLTDEG